MTIRSERSDGVDGRAHFLASVYRWMALGLGISGATAGVVAANATRLDWLLLAGGPDLASWAVIFLPVLLALLFAGRVGNLSPGTTRSLFLSFSVATGVALASVMLVYSPTAAATLFFVAAAAYAAMAVIGHHMARNLSGVGTYLSLVLLGLAVAVTMNLLFRSHVLDLFLAATGLVAFGVLAAVDAQRLRDFHDGESGRRPASDLALAGALILYLDLFSLPLSLLRLTDERR